MCVCARAYGLNESKTRDNRGKKTADARKLAR